MRRLGFKYFFLLLIAFFVFSFFTSLYAAEKPSEDLFLPTQEEASPPFDAAAEYKRLTEEAAQLREEATHLMDQKVAAEKDLAGFQEELTRREAEYTVEDAEAAFDRDQEELAKKVQRVRYYDNRLQVVQSRLERIEDQLPVPEVKDTKISVEEKVAKKIEAPAVPVSLVRPATAAVPEAEAAALKPRDKKEIESEKERIREKYEKGQRARMREAMKEKMEAIEEEAATREVVSEEIEVETVVEAKPQLVEMTAEKAKEKPTLQPIAEPKPQKPTTRADVVEKVKERARKKAKAMAEGEKTPREEAEKDTKAEADVDKKAREKAEKEEKAKAKAEKKAQEKAEKEAKEKAKAEAKSRGEAVRDKVEALREREHAKFKDIDKGYFKERYTEEYYIQQQDFLSKTDKGLRSSIERAIQVHTPTLVAEERIKLAKRKRNKAFRDLFPKAEFEFEYLRGSLSGSAWRGNDYHMKMRQPAFRGGELWFTLLQEDANVRVTDAEYEQVISELYLDVSKAYFEYVRAINVQLAREAAYKQAVSAWEVTRKKWKEGLIAEIEYLNVESLYNQAGHDVESAQQDVALAVLELQRYLGVGREEEIEIPVHFEFDQELNIDMFAQDWIAPGDEETVSMEKVTDESLDKFIQLAYENRPDLRVEVERLRSARYGKKSARGGWFPQCDLIFEWGQLGEAYKDLGGTLLEDLRHKREWHFGLELSYNFLGSTFKYVYDNDLKAPSVTQFRSGLGSMERKNTFTLSFLDDLQQFVDTQEARVTEIEQIVELEDKEREIIRDVKESYFNFHKSYVQLKSVLKRIEYKKKLVLLSKHRLSLNEIQISEYIQAEIELAEERANLYRAISDFYIAKASINRAVGIRNYFPMKYFALAD